MSAAQAQEGMVRVAGRALLMRVVKLSCNPPTTWKVAAKVNMCVRSRALGPK
jgi:hypothetical protein